MSRYIFQGTFRDGQGNIVSSGQIHVFNAGTTTASTIYADDTTTDVSPYVESDSNGYFYFYVDDGDYLATQLFDLQLSKSGYTTKTYPSIAIISGIVTDATIQTTDVTTNNVSTTKHGWTPKLSDSASDFLDGKGNWDQVSDADLAITDVTTNNSSTSKHGFLKKLDNDGTHFMDGTGAWDTVKDSDLALTDITTNDVSTSKHGFTPKLSNSAAQFLNGTGNWTVPSAAGNAGSIRQTVLSSSLDANNLPNFISTVSGLSVNIEADSSNLVISFADGFDTTGPVDHIGYLDTDTSIDNLTDEATNYLFAERNSGTGAITLGKVSVEPIYAYAAPSHAANQYWFSIAEMRMYLSNGADAWTAKQVVFLGEAVTDGTSVTSVINYALRGQYVSPFTNTLPGSATLISFSHNLGTMEITSRCIIELECLSADGGWAVGDRLGDFVAVNSSYFGPITLGFTRNTLWWNAATNVTPWAASAKGTSGDFILLTLAKWKYRAKVKRGW